MSKINVMVCGALGRMGQRIIAAVENRPELSLSGALERALDPRVGQNIGPMVGNQELNLALAGDFAKAVDGAQVYIDFTSVESSLAYLEKAVELGVAAVIGTTGFTREQQEAMRLAGGKIPVLWSPNMSLGVNAMFHLSAIMTKMLGLDYDIEILDAHHRLKKDAPSGTAMKLHEIISESRGLDPEKTLVTGREGIVGERTNDEIAVLAMRAGDIVGDHTVFFCGPGERLELTHRAHTRDTFAEGSARAAAWLVGQKPGFYSVADVLGFGKN